MIPRVLRVVDELFGRRVLVHVRQDEREAVLAVGHDMVLSALVARNEASRRPFLDELGRELCRAGMHHAACFHVVAVRPVPPSEATAAC